MAESLIDILELLAEAIGKSNQSPVPVPKSYGFCASIYGSIEDFFYFYERYCESIYGSDTVSWLQVLPDFLTGEAKNIVEAYGMYKNNKYSDVKIRLIAASSNPAILFCGLTRFFGLKRKPGETITCFCIGLEAAVNQTEVTSRELKHLMIQNKILESLDSCTLEQVKRKFGSELNISNLRLEKFIRLLEMHSSQEESEKNLLVGDPDCKQWQFPVNHPRKCWNCGKPGHLKRACLEITRKRSKGKPEEKLYYGPRQNVWSCRRKYSKAKHRRPVPGIGTSSSAPYNYSGANTAEQFYAEDNKNLNSQYTVTEALFRSSSETFNCPVDYWEPSLDDSLTSSAELHSSVEDMSSSILNENPNSLLEKSHGLEDESGYCTNQSYTSLESAKQKDEYLTLAYSIES